MIYTSFCSSVHTSRKLPLRLVHGHANTDGQVERASFRPHREANSAMLAEALANPFVHMIRRAASLAAEEQVVAVLVIAFPVWPHAGFRRKEPCRWPCWSCNPRPELCVHECIPVLVFAHVKPRPIVKARTPKALLIR